VSGGGEDESRLDSRSRDRGRPFAFFDFLPGRSLTDLACLLPARKRDQALLRHDQFIPQVLIVHAAGVAGSDLVCVGEGPRAAAAAIGPVFADDAVILAVSAIR